MIPFSKRQTVAVAVFACMYAAQSAQVFALGVTVGELNNIYYNLMAQYYVLITVPTGFQVSTTGTLQSVSLDTTIATVLALVEQLNTIVQAIPAGQRNPAYNVPYGVNKTQADPALQVPLPHIQTVVAHGLAQISIAANQPDDGE